MTDISKTLAERGGKYGDFREQGRITQNLKRAMHDSPNWAEFPSYMREGLDMIQHKVSRILNGDALYDDNIHDIIGYAKLMQDRMAADREAGTVFESKGDPMYPMYTHEDGLQEPNTEPGPVLDVSNVKKAAMFAITHGHLESLSHNVENGVVDIKILIRNPVSFSRENPNDFDPAGSLLRVVDLIDFCKRGKKGAMSLDLRDVENLVYLIEESK